MTCQNKFYVSVLIQTDDNQIMIFKQASNGILRDPTEYYWSPIYRALAENESPKNAAAQALEQQTGLKLPHDKIKLITIQTKPLEEYKCWMHIVDIPLSHLETVISDASNIIVPSNNVPHPQNWILNTYLEQIEAEALSGGFPPV